MLGDSAPRTVQRILKIAISWLEAQLPVFFAVPGMKLGLTNLVVITALYYLSWQDGLALNLVRIVLVGFTFGNMFSVAYSMPWELLSIAVMPALKKRSIPACRRQHGRRRVSQCGADARKDWKSYTKRNLWLLFVIDMAITGLYSYVINHNPINEHTNYTLTEIWIPPTIIYGLAACFVSEKETQAKGK